MIRLGFFLLVIGASLLVLSLCQLNPCSGYSFVALLSVIIASDLLFLGGVLLLLVSVQRLLRACKRSLAHNGLALCGVSVIAGLLWSLGR